jgi:hypothetical protein
LPADQAAEMADRDMGRRMAEKAYADAYARTQPSEGYQPTSQIGRFAKSVFGSSPERIEENRRQTALNIAKNQVQGMSPAFKDQSETDYNAETLRNQQMREHLYSPEFKNKTPQYVMPQEGSDENTPARTADRLTGSNPVSVPEGYARPPQSLTDQALGVVGLRRADTPSSSTNTQVQTADQPPAGNPAPAAGSQLTDRVNPSDLLEVNRPAYAPIGQAGGLPSMARIGGGAAPVAANVQDRTVGPGLIEMAKDSLMPNSMRYAPHNLMFSSDKDRVVNAATAARNAAPAAKPAAAPATTPAQGGNFFSNLFKGGPEVQSNGQAVVQRMQGPLQEGQDRAPTKLNWGNSSGPEGSAADFFRADKARQELEKSGEAFTGMNRGGTAQAPGKDAALHKALEIIHHMITRGR